ncbi:MAG: hypothetical protein A3G27_00190 [Betaproteobacteria bacterium RIFCSPLOWO2_12_FULL_66_14]|nr:MAG: hypothetical protein A3G27_00190 [Betaproteobacteria bacterium RIFCSPLOWO2_12_FULL_66_14]
MQEELAARFVFTGNGVQGIQDFRSRSPEALVSTYAQCLRVLHHPKITYSTALLVIAPELAIRFKEAGWSKQRLKDAIIAGLSLDIGMAWGEIKL